MKQMKQNGILFSLIATVFHRPLCDSEASHEYEAGYAKQRMKWNVKPNANETERKRK